MNSSALKKSYFLHLNDKQLGPYTEAELIQFHKEGHITDATMVWAESMPNWQPYNTIKLGLSEVSAPHLKDHSHGDHHYEEKVFPEIKAGKNVFNWWAFLFSPYWLAYKGMWKVWAIAMVPYSIVYDLVEGFGLKPHFVGFILAGWMGSKANAYYYEHYMAKKNAGKKLSEGSKLSGIGGICAFLIVSAITMAFMEGFVPAFKSSFAESYNNSRNQ